MIIGGGGIPISVEFQNAANEKWGATFILPRKVISKGTICDLSYKALRIGKCSCKLYLRH